MTPEQMKELEREANKCIAQGTFVLSTGQVLSPTSALVNRLLAALKSSEQARDADRVRLDMAETITIDWSPSGKSAWIGGKVCTTLHDLTLREMLDRAIALSGGEKGK